MQTTYNFDCNFGVTLKVCNLQQLYYFTALKTKLKFLYLSHVYKQCKDFVLIKLFLTTEWSWEIPDCLLLHANMLLQNACCYYAN